MGVANSANKEARESWRGTKEMDKSGQTTDDDDDDVVVTCGGGKFSSLLLTAICKRKEKEITTATPSCLKHKNATTTGKDYTCTDNVQRGPED